MPTKLKAVDDQTILELFGNLSRRNRWGPPPEKIIEEAPPPQGWPTGCSFKKYTGLVYCPLPTPSHFDPWAGVEPSFEAALAELGPVTLPSPSSPTACAMFTVVRNEAILLPIWARYYGRHFDPSDMLVLDHNGTDRSTDAIPLEITVHRLSGDSAFMPHRYLNNQVQLFQQLLLRNGYSCVVFSEVDEIILADSRNYEDGLRGFLREFVRSDSAIYVKPAGKTISHELNGSRGEPPLDWSREILAQRHHWANSSMFSKPYITKIPLQYTPGFHAARPFPAPRGSNGSAEGPGRLSVGPDIPISSDLVLVHLHGADYEYCMGRERSKYEQSRAGMHVTEKRQFMGYHFTHFQEFVNKGLMCTALLETSAHIETIPSFWRESPV